MQERFRLWRIMQGKWSVSMGVRKEEEKGERDYISDKRIYIRHTQSCARHSSAQGIYDTIESEVEHDRAMTKPL